MSKLSSKYPLEARKPHINAPHSVMSSVYMNGIYKCNTTHAEQQIPKQHRTFETTQKLHVLVFSQTIFYFQIMS